MQQTVAEMDESKVPLLRHVLTLSGTVIPHIWGWLLYSVMIGSIVSFVSEIFKVELVLQSDSMNIAGSMLGFLLVFRTNIAYSRYWEARGAVGAAISTSRDLASQTAVFV